MKDNDNLETTLHALYTVVRLSFKDFSKVTEYSKGYVIGYNKALEAVARLHEIDPDLITRSTYDVEEE